MAEFIFYILTLTITKFGLSQISMDGSLSSKAANAEIDQLRSLYREESNVVGTNNDNEVVIRAVKTPGWNDDGSCDMEMYVLASELEDRRAIAKFFGLVGAKDCGVVTFLDGVPQHSAMVATLRFIVLGNGDSVALEGVGIYEFMKYDY
jgi:hypothetical protein